MNIYFVRWHLIGLQLGTPNEKFQIISKNKLNQLLELKIEMDFSADAYAESRESNVIWMEWNCVLLVCINSSTDMIFIRIENETFSNLRERNDKLNISCGSFR